MRKVIGPIAFTTVTAMVGFVGYIQFGVLALPISFCFWVVVGVLLELGLSKHVTPLSATVITTVAAIGSAGAFFLGERFGVVMMDIVTRTSTFLE